jgi:hypothetical protein
MFSHVADIKRYTYDIGQWHLDQKMPLLADKLKEAWKEAYAKGTTNSPKPVNPSPNPFPPPEKTPERNNTEETLEELKNTATAFPETGIPNGDDTRTAQNRAAEAQINEAKAQADVIWGTKNATKYLFDEWAWGRGNERKQMDAINKTVENAAKSGDLTQFNAAKEFSDIISRYGTNDKEGKPYDNANTFNSLADFSGNMIGLLAALRSLIERIDGVEVNVSQEN